MVKFRLYFDKDMEEDFLNRLASQGFAMTSFFLGFYGFEPSLPGEYTYQIDLISNKSTLQKNELFDLIRESGGELVQTWGAWAYFRKKGRFELYSDFQSRIAHYSSIRNTFLILALVETLISAVQWRIYTSGHGLPYVSYVSPLILSLLSLILWLQVYKTSLKIRLLSE